jgi:hypothetical protein
VGSHAPASQVFPFQGVDLIGKGSHLGGFKRSRLFTPSHLELRELTNNWREAGFVVLAVELGSMPSPKRALQMKIEEVGTRVGLEAYTLITFRLAALSWYFKKK